MGHRHNPDFALPFPTLPVIIRHAKSGRATGELPALLDTGADGTLVPITYLEAIQAPRYQAARLRSHWGEWLQVVTYLVELEVAGERLVAIEVVADERGDQILLGRNVLNKLILLNTGRNS